MSPPAVCRLQRRRGTDNTKKKMGAGGSALMANRRSVWVPGVAGLTLGFISRRMYEIRFGNFSDPLRRAGVLLVAVFQPLTAYIACAGTRRNAVAAWDHRPRG